MTPSDDPWLEHEQAVRQLARLVLRASALGERPGYGPAARTAGARRLADGVDHLRRALQAAVRVPL